MIFKVFCESQENDLTTASNDPNQNIHNSQSGQVSDQTPEIVNSALVNSSKKRFGEIGKGIVGDILLLGIILFGSSDQFGMIVIILPIFIVSIFLTVNSGIALIKDSQSSSKLIGWAIIAPGIGYPLFILIMSIIELYSKPKIYG